MPGICDLKNASLCVVEQKDLAITVGIVSGFCSFSRNVAVRNENNETPISTHVAERGRESNVRVRSDLNEERVRGCARRLGRDRGV